LFELILFCILGCCYGLILGLLPGISNSIGMVIAYPFLLHVDPLNTIVFYIGMTTCVQYFGGASASLLGIPTETSCLPSVREGFALTSNGKVSEALSVGALSSFAGSIFAAILATSIFYIGNNYSLLFNFKLQFAIIVLTCAITVISSNNILISSVLLVCGYFLGMVGVNSITRQPFLTFDNPYLVSGIPEITVLVFLYSLPQLLRLKTNKLQFHLIESIKLKFLFPLWSTLRGSLVGFICGFIPMLGIIISSNLSYSLERWLNRKTYDSNGDVRGLCASDSGHNSGLVASFIPLFCFAIPITASEYVLYDITTNRGMVYNLEWLLEYYWILFVFFLLANIIGIITAWPFAIKLTKLIVKNINYFKLIGITLLLGSVIQISYTTNQLLFYSILGAVFFPIGFVLRKLDLLPLVLGFLLAQQFDSVSRIVYNLYIGG